MNKTKTLFFSAMLSLASVIATAQAPTFNWAGRIGNTGTDACKSMALDASGNVIHAGMFEGTVDFNPGSGTFNLTAVSTGGGYVSKLDPSGNFVWAVAIPGPAEAVATDASGNIFVTGTYTNTQDFDPGSGTVNLTAASSNYMDAYVVKFDNSGNFIWAMSIGGIDEELPESIATDASGNVILCGSFRNTVDFDPGAGTNNISSGGAQDGFVVKLNSAGAFSWAAKFGAGFSGEMSNDLAVDASGNIFVTGIFAGTVDFDPGSNFVPLTATSGNDAYVVKLDAAGNYAWAKGFGNVGVDEGNAIALDATGNVYVGGTFAGTVDFDPSSSASYTVTAVGSYDAYISKLDGSGNFVFVKTVGSTSFDKCKDLQVSPSGFIFYVGYYSGTADFNPSSTGTYTMASAGSFDSFASLLDASGNFVWAGGLATMAFDYMEAVAINASNDIYLGGSFMFTCDFDMGAGTNNLTSAGNNDIFVMKLNNTLAGIHEIGSLFVNVKAYPNPNSGSFNVISSAPFTIIKVYNQLGSLVLEKESEGLNTSIEMNNAAKGIYFYQIMNKNEVMKAGKIVVK